MNVYLSLEVLPIIATMAGKVIQKIKHVKDLYFLDILQFY